MPAWSASRAACSTDPSGGFAVQRPQAVALGNRAGKAGEDRLGLRRPGELVLEVDQHLEMLGEFRVVGEQQEIEQPVADEHDLHLERDGIGFERDGAREAEEAADVLDGDLSALQRAFQRRPTEGLHQKRAGVENQVAAARAMDGARLDQQEIGHEHPVRRHIVDAADEVAERRVKLLDERRAGSAVLRDQQIDLIALERGGLRRIGRLALAALGSGGGEHRHALDQIRAHRLDMLGDARHVGEGGANLLDQMVDRIFGGLAVERPDLVAPLLVPLRNLANDALELLFQRRDLGLSLGALLFGPGVELVRRHDLAVRRRRHGEADRRAQQQDRFLGGLLPQRGEGLELLLLERFVDGAAPRLVVLALERRRGRALQVLDQLVHRVLEAGRAARRELDRDRPVGLDEIVDIDPVGRPGARSRFLGQHGLDGVSHPDARPADDEEVEARLVDLRAEFHRLERARLPDHPVDRLELSGGHEGQARKVAGSVQLVGGKRPNRAFGSSKLAHRAPIAADPASSPTAARRRLLDFSSVRSLHRAPSAPADAHTASAARTRVPDASLASSVACA